MCDPAAAGTGALGQSRKITSCTGRSGVNVTTIEPATVDDGGSTSTVASYRGRCGSGSASGPGSGHPAMKDNGLAVVVVDAIVVDVVLTSELGATDEDGFDAV